MQCECTQSAGLVETFLGLLERFSGAFGQRRVFERACCLVWGTLFAFARKTLSSIRTGAGQVYEDWTADYRLFSRGRLKMEALSSGLLRLTLEHVSASEPYTTAIDATHVPRSGKKIPGTAWGRALQTAPWDRGLEWMQRFVNLCWLTPEQSGYRQAIPLRWLHAPTPSATPSQDAACKEWEAGREALSWLRGMLDREGRSEQWLAVAADGSYDVNAFWTQLPPRTAAIVRCAKNRKLFTLPKPAQQPARGAPRKYGDRLPTPAQLRQEPRKVWEKCRIPVRGSTIEVKYRVVGPVLVEGASEQPLYMILVKGYHRRKLGKSKRREPCQYLVNAVCQNGQWQLPLSLELILSLIWHRWEIEVCHRGIKSGFGLGQIQSWSKLGGVLSVQFMAWVYALIMLVGYKAWGGLLHSPARPTPWWPGSRRWSLNTVLQALRQEVWQLGDFQPVWAQTGAKGQNKPNFMAGLTNAVLGCKRA